MTIAERVRVKKLKKFNNTLLLFFFYFEVWSLLQAGPCPPTYACKVYEPLCAVSEGTNYQSFLNACLMDEERRLTGKGKTLKKNLSWQTCVSNWIIDGILRGQCPQIP